MLFSLCLGGTWEVTSRRVCVRFGDKGPPWDSEKGNSACGIERSAVTDADQQMLERREHDEEFWHWEEKRGMREVPD